MTTARSVVHRQPLSRPGRRARALAVVALVGTALAGCGSSDAGGTDDTSHSGHTTDDSQAQAHEHGDGVAASLAVGNTLASVEIVPGTTGTNEVHVEIASATGELIAPQAVTASLTSPSGAVVPVLLAPDGPKHFQALAAELGESGVWTILLEVTAADTPNATLTGTVTIG